jgi:hypothetical protein
MPRTAWRASAALPDVPSWWTGRAPRMSTRGNAARQQHGRDRAEYKRSTQSAVRARALTLGHALAPHNRRGRRLPASSQLRRLSHVSMPAAPRPSPARRGCALERTSTSCCHSHVCSCRSAPVRGCRWRSRVDRPPRDGGRRHRMQSCRSHSRHPNREQRRGEISFSAHKGRVYSQSNRLLERRRAAMAPRRKRSTTSSTSISAIQVCRERH